MTNRLLIYLAFSATLSLGSVALAQAAGTTGQPTPTTSPGAKVQRFDSNGQPIAEQSAQGQAATGITRASSLVGRHIFDTSGASIGQIRDLVIAPDGQVIAVLDRQSGGMTGVPLSSLSAQLEAPAPGVAGASGATGVGGANPQTTAVVRFVFAGDRNLLDTSPQLKDLNTLDDQWPASVGQHFGVPVGQVRFPEQPTTPAARTPGADAVSMGSAQTARRAMAFQALMKRQLSTVSGDRLGNLRDVAIDLDTGRASFVVFGRPGAGATGATGVGGTTETLHGVELDALSFNEPSTAMIDIDTASIDQSPGIDLGRLPRQASLRAHERSQRGVAPGQTGQTGRSGAPGQSGKSGASDRGSSTPRGAGSSPRS